MRIYTEVVYSLSRPDGCIKMTFIFCYIIQIKQSLCTLAGGKIRRKAGITTHAGKMAFVYSIVP